MDLTADTSTSVTHWQRRPDTGWWLCYDRNVQEALNTGHTVMRVTTVHTTTREILERS